MKSLLISFLVLLASFSFSACSNSGQSKQEAEEAAAENSRFSAEELSAQQQLWDQVMTIHDEVMPKMGNMHQLTKALKAQWETNESLTAETKEAISVAIQELESADEGMWDWMHSLQKLDQLRSAKSQEEILSYLEEQEQSIILVREAMVNSMAEADSILTAVQPQ